MSNEIERLLVAGASGDTGRELLRQLRSVDVQVRAMTRSPNKERELSEEGADEVIVGDLLDPADASRAVADCDAVLCAVGSSPGLDALLGGDLVDGVGVENLVYAAVAAGVEGFVFESSIGVGDSREGMPAALRLPLWHVLNQKNHAESVLRTSGLSYTVIRPGGLTNAPATGNVLVGEGGESVSGSIPREDVARLMIAALFTPDAENRTFEVVSREGQRGTARGVVEIDWQVPGEHEIEIEE
ncbi:3-beta hydroxysteroid dehydrogenase [Haladaptatus sp. R4]|uniref:SDR family oxidoreductase n=1 Tax=Haladaptatus sp. R4 TaxID=1679489 RepID=UPI0007B4CEE8|nr:SDR family oxidoreductase [Haladaptatus sp. R4]KZN25520.1 3-beta hydroxysteroid dehydrogenase [Haladaptatus sp. R4]